MLVLRTRISRDSLLLNLLSITRKCSPFLGVLLRLCWPALPGLAHLPLFGAWHQPLPYPMPSSLRILLLPLR